MLSNSEVIADAMVRYYFFKLLTIIFCHEPDFYRDKFDGHLAFSHFYCFSKIMKSLFSRTCRTLLDNSFDMQDMMDLFDKGGINAIDLVRIS